MSWAQWSGGYTDPNSGDAIKAQDAGSTFNGSAISPTTTTTPRRRHDDDDHDARPTQHGYWLVGSDGGIFTFGAAQFYGSTGSLKLQRPIVGIAPTSEPHGLLARGFRRRHFRLRHWLLRLYPRPWLQPGRLRARQ